VSELKRVLGTSVATVLTDGVAIALAVSGAQAAATPGWRFVAFYPQADDMSAVSASSATNAWVLGQTDGVDLFASHWNGKAWPKVAVPKGVSLGSLANDGHGGAWMTSNQSALVMYHYWGGRWTHVPGPVKSGYVTELRSDLELIPGTRSVLAIADLSAKNGFEAATLKYGP
jgi:hypothetical protein